MLEAQGLRRDFRHRCVLGPLDFSAPAGSRIAITGPNGAGKSTLLRCVVGTVAPTAGTVVVGGHDAGTRSARRLIGVSLSQERSFYLRLTGLQNLLTFARLRAPLADARQAVAAVVAELELHEIAARRVDRCSTGMVQQLALARALLGDPPLLLLDEPTRSLDDAAVERMWRAVDARPQSTLLIATHRHEDIDRCERALALPVG
jgi:ABC-type multidrug transport system ATPase subunit